MHPVSMSNHACVLQHLELMLDRKDAHTGAVLSILFP